MYHKYSLRTAVDMWRMASIHGYCITAALQVETCFDVTTGYT